MSQSTTRGNICNITTSMQSYRKCSNICLSMYLQRWKESLKLVLVGFIIPEYQNPVSFSILIILIFSHKHRLLFSRSSSEAAPVIQHRGANRPTKRRETEPVRELRTRRSADHDIESLPNLRRQRRSLSIVSGRIPTSLVFGATLSQLQRRAGKPSHIVFSDCPCRAGILTS